MCQKSLRPGIRGPDLKPEPDEDEEEGHDAGDEERMKIRGAHTPGTSCGVAVNYQSEVARYTREVAVDKQGEVTVEGLTARPAAVCAKRGQVWRGSVGTVAGRSGVARVPGVGGGEVEAVDFWVDV